MKILVLGSTGYLGGNIVHRLIGAGHEVFCVVRKTSDLSRIDSLPVKYIINNYEQIELTLKTEKIDWIINGVCTYNKNHTWYEDMFESNLVFPLNILNLAMKYSVPNFMTMGTGLPNDFNVYSYTKGQLSEIGKFFSTRSEINFFDLKLEMFYGGMFEPESRFIRNTIKKLYEGQSLELTSGKQKRDIVRVEDICDIIIAIIEEYRDEHSGYHRIPIGTGEHHSIKEIVEYLKEVTGSSSELKFGALKDRENGEPDTLADMSWLKEKGRKMNYSYFEGLKEVAQRYAPNRSEYQQT